MTVVITYMQSKYLESLRDSPKTSRDLVFEMEVTASSVAKTLKNLRGAGLVKSEYLKGSVGRRYIHALAAKYEDLDFCVDYARTKRTVITEEHLYYMAILRNAMMTGRELEDQFMSMYPVKSKNSVHNILTKTKARGLCR